jgi:acyl carrier protein
MIEDDAGIRQAVLSALATELKVDERAVAAAKSLKNDLRMDSIAAVNVAFVLEERFELEIDLDGVDDFDCVEGIVEVVRRALTKKCS